jgi:hypothetical protein
MELKRGKSAYLTQFQADMSNTFLLTLSISTGTDRATHYRHRQK